MFMHIWSRPIRVTMSHVCDVDDISYTVKTGDSNYQNTKYWIEFANNMSGCKMTLTLDQWIEVEFRRVIEKSISDSISPIKNISGCSSTRQNFTVLFTAMEFPWQIWSGPWIEISCHDRIEPKRWKCYGTVSKRHQLWQSKILAAPLVTEDFPKSDDFRLNTAATLPFGVEWNIT